MKTNLFKLNKLLIAVMFLLFLPFKMVAAELMFPYWGLISSTTKDINNPIVATVEDPVGSGTYTGSFTLTEETSVYLNNPANNNTPNYYSTGKAEDFAIGKRVEVGWQFPEQAVAMTLPAGKYDFLVETNSDIYLTITPNDGSLNYIEHSTDGVNWKKAETDGFSLTKAQYAAGDKLYLRHVYKNKDDVELDQTTYTYYYGGTVPSSLADDATISMPLSHKTDETGKIGVADMPYLTFEAAGRYSIDALAIDEKDRTKATITVSRIGFRPTFPEAKVNCKITHDSGVDEKTAVGANTEITIQHNSDLEFSITGTTTEEGKTTTYALYPTESIALSHTIFQYYPPKDDKDTGERAITFSTDERYKGNYIKSFNAAKLTPTSIVCGEGEVTMKYKYIVDGESTGDGLPRIILFDGAAVPSASVAGSEKCYLTSSDIEKEVLLRYNGDMTYSGVITLTKEDIDNNVLTFAVDHNWPSNRGYCFSTSTNNVLLRGEGSKMVIGADFSNNGLLRFGSRFTPGVYRITVECTGSDENDFTVPATITLVPAGLVYYMIEDKNGTSEVGWRESVGVGILRKFNYTDDEVSSKRIRPEFNANKLRICTDLIDGDGSHIVSYYTGTVDFPDDEADGAVRTFRLVQTSDSNAGITVNAKGQFMMSFDRNTEILTVTRAKEASVPVRAAVAVDKGADKGKYTIIPVGGKLTVQVTEAEANAKAGTTFRFAANYDTYLTADSYSARIYPQGDVVFGNKDYEYYSFDRVHSGTVTAKLPGYYTFTARVYPKLNQVLIACQYTSYNPRIVMKSDFSDAKFAKYPYVKGYKSKIQKYKDGGDYNRGGFTVKAMTTYVLRGDPLINHNKFLEAAGNDPIEPLVPLESPKYNIRWKYDDINGDRLDSIPGGYERGELVRGNRYTMESVEDLFGQGGIIGHNASVTDDAGNQMSGNFVNLVKLREAGQARVQGRLEAAGGRVSYVVQWASSMKHNRLCYFYVTPDMRQNIIDKYQNSEQVSLLNGYESFSLAFDSDDGLYTKCLIAAISDGIIPGFAVLSDASHREAVRYLDLKSTEGNRYKPVQSTLLQDIWQDGGNSREYYKDGCWIEGSRIPLAYFGDDYRGESSADFPSGTYIYPYILVAENEENSMYALPYGPYVDASEQVAAADVSKPTVNEENYTPNVIKFSDNRLNLISVNNGANWSSDDLKNDYVNKLVNWAGYGAPSAMTFNYRTKNVRGEVVDMALVTWEDLGTSIKDNDWCDIVLNVDGVKSVFKKPYSAVDFDVDARPDASAKTEENTYTHIVSLKPKTTALGRTDWTMDFFGTPYAIKNEAKTGWIAHPSYSYIDVFRDDTFIGQVVFKKNVCQAMLDSEYKTEEKLAKNDLTDDSDLHTSLSYGFYSLYDENGAERGRLLGVDGNDIVFEKGKSESDVDKWTEIFHKPRNDGHEKVDISCVRFTDSFAEPFGHTTHAYKGSFYSSSSLIDSEPDEVIVPASELTVSVGTGSELPAEADYKAKATTTLPNNVGEDGSSAAIVVSRNLNLAGKEVITSYDVYEVPSTPSASKAARAAEDAESQAEMCVAKVVPVATIEKETGEITANGWKVSAPGKAYDGIELKDNSAEVDGDTYQVKLGDIPIEGGKTYRVEINTEVPAVAEKDLSEMIKCEYVKEPTIIDALAQEANTYGAKPAKAEDAVSALRLTVPDPEKGTLRFVDSKLAVTYATTPSWTIDLSAFPGVEPGDVKYYLWRRYTTGTPAFEPVDGMASDYYIPTLFANESTPGMIPADTYRNWSWADQNIDLATEGSTSGLSDVLVTDYVGDDAYAETGQPLAAEYTLYAYIPAYEKKTDGVKARSYGDQTAATRYYVLKATAPVETTNMEIDVLTGIEGVASGMGDIKVTGANGVLTVTGASRVSVYTVSGVEVYAAEGDITTTLPSGIYVVRADSKAVKISL